MLTNAMQVYPGALTTAEDTFLWATSLVLCATASPGQRAREFSLTVGSRSRLLAAAESLCPEHASHLSFHSGDEETQAVLTHAPSRTTVNLDPVHWEAAQVGLMASDTLLRLTAERLAVALGKHFPLPLGIFYGRPGDDADFSVAQAAASRLVLQVTCLYTDNPIYSAHYARMQGASASGGKGRLRFALRRSGVGTALETESALTSDAIVLWVSKKLAGAQASDDGAEEHAAAFLPRFAGVLSVGSAADALASAIGQRNVLVIALFVTLSCGHCRAAHLAFHRAADSMTQDDPSAPVQWVDALGGSHPLVHGVPSVIAWWNGRPTRFDKGKPKDVFFLVLAHSSKQRKRGQTL